MLAAAATHDLNYFCWCFVLFFFPDLATDDFDQGKRDNLLFLVVFCLFVSCSIFWVFFFLFPQLYPLKSYRKGTFYFCCQWLASLLGTWLLSLQKDWMRRCPWKGLSVTDLAFLVCWSTGCFRGCSQDSPAALHLHQDLGSPPAAACPVPNPPSCSRALDVSPLPRDSSVVARGAQDPEERSLSWQEQGRMSPNPKAARRKREERERTSLRSQPSLEQVTLWGLLLTVCFCSHCPLPTGNPTSRFGNLGALPRQQGRLQGLPPALPTLSRMMVGRICTLAFAHLCLQLQMLCGCGLSAGHIPSLL